MLFTLRCAKDTVSFAKERTITREIGGPPLATLAKSKHGGFVLRLSQSRQCWPSYFPSWVHGFAILCLHVLCFFGGAIFVWTHPARQNIKKNGTQ